MTPTAQPTYAELVARLRTAANQVIVNACDTGTYGPPDVAEEYAEDFPIDAEGDPWYHDFWELNQAIEAIEHVCNEPAREEPAREEPANAKLEATVDAALEVIDAQRQALCSATRLIEALLARIGTLSQ